MSHEPEAPEEMQPQELMEHMNQPQNGMVHASPPPPPPPMQPAYYPVDPVPHFAVATPYGLTAFQAVQYMRHRHTHHPHMVLRPPTMYVPPATIAYRPHGANQPVASGCIPVTSVGQAPQPLQYFVPSGHHILPPSLPQVLSYFFYLKKCIVSPMAPFPSIFYSKITVQCSLTGQLLQTYAATLWRVEP